MPNGVIVEMHGLFFRDVIAVLGVLITTLSRYSGLIEYVFVQKESLEIFYISLFVRGVMTKIPIRLKRV